MPARADIDPAELGPALPHLMLLKFEHEPFRAKYTLVGTTIARSSGFDFTGYYVDELHFRGDMESDWMAVYRQLVDERRPILGINRYTLRDATILEYGWGKWPLSEDGQLVTGCLAAEEWPRGTDIRVHDVENPVPPDKLKD